MNDLMTVSDLEARFGAVLDHLDRELAVPLDTLPSPQGDVFFCPTALDPHANPSGPWNPVGPAGVVLVAGQHDHTLHCESGTVLVCPASDRSGNVTHLIDATEGVAVIAHVEHAFRRFAGKWSVRIQTEGGAERRRQVAD